MQVTNNLKDKIRKLTLNKLNKKDVYKILNKIKHPYKCNRYKNTIYLVYTMGKVGSTTISKTIDTYLKVADVFDVHRLSEKWFKERENESDEKTKNFYVKYDKANQIKKLIKSKAKIKIVTVTRDPIQKKISGFFQNPWLYGLNEESLSNLDANKVCELINQKVNLEQNFFLDAINWFDQEFYEFTGIDVYSHQFDFKLKRQIISQNNIDILVLRLEDFKTNQELVKNNLAEFIGEPIDKLVNSNQTENKASKNLYKKVLELITFPDDFIEQMYNSKYCKHFYEKAEIEKLKLKWRSQD